MENSDTEKVRRVRRLNANYFFAAHWFLIFLASNFQVLYRKLKLSKIPPFTIAPPAPLSVQSTVLSQESAPLPAAAELGIPLSCLYTSQMMFGHYVEL